MSEISWPGGSPEATIGIVAAITALYAGATWIATIVWTLRDISQRTRNVGAIMGASILVTTTFVFGLALYLIVRPRQTLRQRYELQLEEQVLMQELTRVHSCPNCARPVMADFIACPACATNLKAQCRSCSRAIDHSWVACPFCADRNPVPASVSMRPQHTVERTAPAKQASAAVVAEPVVAAQPLVREQERVAASAVEPATSFDQERAFAQQPVVGRIVQPATAVELEEELDDEERAAFRAAS